MVGRRKFIKSIALLSALPFVAKLLPKVKAKPESPQTMTALSVKQVPQRSIIGLATENVEAFGFTTLVVQGQIALRKNGSAFKPEISKGFGEGTKYQRVQARNHSIKAGTFVTLDDCKMLDGINGLPFTMPQTIRDDIFLG